MKFKRILAVVLSALMLTSMASFTVSAKEDAELMAEPLLELLVSSDDAKAAGHKVVILAPEYGDDNLPKADSLIALFNKVTALMRAGKVYSAYTPTLGGIAEAVYKMCIGNGLGFKFDESMCNKAIFSHAAHTVGVTPSPQPAKI